MYELLVKFARIAREHGRDRIGIRLLWERMRWEMFVTVRATEDDDYRLNNDWLSRYARLIMADEPDLDGIFEIRRLRAL